MRVLNTTYRNIFLLFLILCAPSIMFSKSGREVLDVLNPCSEVFEIGTGNQSNISKSIINKLKKKGKKHKKLLYYLYVDDFIQSFIKIDTENVSMDSTTIKSKYLAGRAALYNEKDEKVGICSASFLCMQNSENIFTDISNYLTVENGLVISWFTPTTLINLELDSILHSMVTECIVLANTKIGFNPYYGKKFNMIVSSDSGKIYFKLREIK